MSKTKIHIDYYTKNPALPNCGATDGKCQSCGSDLKSGFGLAGGGYGVYEYCDSADCNKVVTKTETTE
jgi:hypothetical protein